MAEVEELLLYSEEMCLAEEEEAEERKMLPIGREENEELGELGHTALLLS